MEMPLQIVDLQGHFEKPTTIHQAAIERSADDCRGSPCIDSQKIL